MLAGAWYAGICALSARPGSSEPAAWPWRVLSNAAHGPLFGILAAALGLLLARDDRGWPRLDGARARGVLAAVVALGTLDELHQSVRPLRDGSLFDVVTDVAGAWAALSIVAALARPGTSPLARLALAALISVAAGALATFGPSCFPGATWL